MDWANSAIWWHVYPLGFTGAPIRDADPAAGVTPRLRHLIGWLDYAVDLGVNGLLLGPIFASQTHGYDAVDQFRIDPRLGTEEDFDALIAACRARGIRVVLDGVFSHVGSDHPALRRAVAEGPDGSTAALFDIDWERGHPRVWEGHGSLARLNHASDEAVEYVSSVMTYWLARGIDGWRLDAAYSVDTAFWARVLAPVREAYPQAWFLGEVIHGDYAAFVSASGVDTVTEYELWKAIWSSQKDANLWELDWALTRHNEFLESFVPQTFVGNHDVTRIASLVGERGALIALAILMTVGGIPSIYSGDEQGFVGVKEEREGGDDAVRPAFPDLPGELAPWGTIIYRAHQDLLGLRRRHPWLTTARTEKLDLSNERYVYLSRSATSQDALEVAIDLSGVPTARITSAGQVLWAAPEMGGGS